MFRKFSKFLKAKVHAMQNRVSTMDRYCYKLAIILSISWAGIMIMNHTAWAGTSCLRPLSIAESGRGLSGLDPGGDGPGTGYYNRKRGELHPNMGSMARVVVREGGPVFVSGLGQNGEPIGGVSLGPGEGVVVRIGPPHRIPDDKILPAGVEVIKVMRLPGRVREATGGAQRSAGEAI